MSIILIGEAWQYYLETDAPLIVYCCFSANQIILKPSNIRLSTTLCFGTSEIPEFLEFPGVPQRRLPKMPHSGFFRIFKW